METNKDNHPFDNSLSRKMHRRDFLAASCSGALAACGFLLAGCSDSSQKHTDFFINNQTFDEELLNSAQRKAPEKDELDLKIDDLLSDMSLEHKVAQLFIVRPESITGVDVVSVAGELTREALRRWTVGGLVYFDQNLFDQDQTTQMLAGTMQFALESSGIPPFLCVDEEGGLVSRIAGNPWFYVENPGNMADIGASGDAGLAKSVASQIAGYLGPLGFNVDFAPVCDIANNPYGNAMRERSFGSDPDLVARMVEAQVEGFLEAGMLCCAKHFPGIGGVAGDSHFTQITSDKTAEEMDDVELVPFKAAIRAGVPFLMVGHLSVPSITGDDTPASLSPAVVEGVLRDRLGYQGIVITDSLEMGAISEYFSPEEAAYRALVAGCDIALMPIDFESSFNYVINAVGREELSESRIEQSVRRILRVKLKALGGLFPQQ